MCRIINIFPTMSKVIYSRDHQHLVDKLKRARIKAGLRQKDVALKLYRTQSYVSKVESGQRKIDIVQLKKFASIYKKPVDYFVR